MVQEDVEEASSDFDICKPKFSRENGFCPWLPLTNLLYHWYFLIPLYEVIMLVRSMLTRQAVKKHQASTVVVNRQAEEVGKRALDKLRTQGNHKHMTRARLKKCSWKWKSRRHLNQSTVKLKIIKEPVNCIHFRYAALDSREQRVARIWDPTHHTLVTLGHSWAPKGLHREGPSGSDNK